MTNMKLFWPLLRAPVLWGTMAWLVCMVIFSFAMVALVSMPTKWDKAVVLKVCGGLPVVQLQDGTIWLRDRWRFYRVEIDKLECSP